VDAVVKSLADGSNPAMQSADRLWLISGATDAGGKPASDGYLVVYAKSVNSHLVTLISDKNANFRAKIEAGIAAARIAAVAHNTELAPVATTLMGDTTSQALALVGMRVAQAMVPTIMSGPQPGKTEAELLGQMLDTVHANTKPPEGGEIANGAYQALSDSVFKQPRATPANISQFLVLMVVNLEKERLEQYTAQSKARVRMRTG